MSNPRQEFHDQMLKIVRSEPPDRVKSRSLLRAKIWNLLEYDHGKVGHVINWFLFILILLSVLALPIEIIPDLQKYRPVAQIIEIFGTLVFSTEYFLRIYAAPNRFKYIVSWQGLFDLLAALPYYLTFFPIPVLLRRGLPFFRLVRLFKVVHVKSLQGIEQELQDEKIPFLHYVELLEGEKIEKVALKHPIFFMLHLLLPMTLGIAGVFTLLFWHFAPWAIAVSAVLFLFMLVFFYNAWLDYFYDVIYITNYRIVLQDKYLFGHADNQVEYRNITNIRPSHTSIWSALFDFGSIIIETSAEKGIIEDRNIRHHEKIAHYIQQKCREYTAGTNVPPVTKS